MSSKLLNDWKISQEYYVCVDIIDWYFDAWYKNYNDGQYVSSIFNYLEYIKGNWNKDDKNSKIAFNNLNLSLEKVLASNNKENLITVKKYLSSFLVNDPGSFFWCFDLWVVYYYLDEYDNSIKYLNYALEYTEDKEYDQLALSYIEKNKEWIELLKLKNNPPTKDELSYLQHYLYSLNVLSAWKKVSNSKEVIVAVIDDWMYINNPDLTGKIWQKSNAPYWSSIVIDFTWDNLVNYTSGEHGTMVAWIIWATQNNNEWIAWIAKNVKIMPLRVFGSWWVSKEEYLIDAINFAVNNGANIINISLWKSQFTYSNKFDSVIKNAYDKWVIVVIAAWNWDILSKEQIWINLTLTPVSPVCNNSGNSKYSIWVYSTDKKWTKTNWTNYWNCAQIMAPWESIISTSVPVYNSKYWSNYNILDWTSFSAPIISWIIALWYNQYWYVSPDVVFDSLKSSISKNSAWNEYVDAEKYIDILWTKMSQAKSEQKTNTWVVSNNLSSVANSQTISTNKQTLSNGDFLASAWIVKKQDSDEQYRLNDFVLRQEVIWIAIKLWKITLPDAYSCKWYFGDVSSIKPNNWACRAVEISADNWIITKSNPKFRPEDKITKAEALAILLKWAKINIEQSTSSNFIDVSVSWQINTINTALNKKIIDQWNYFFPNQNATRWEIFEIAKRILNLNN